MSQVGQNTATGGRAWNIGLNGGAARRVTVPTNFTVNYVGAFLSEQTGVQPNTSNVRAALYANNSSNTLTAQSNILVQNIVSNSVFTDTHILFGANGPFPAGDYIIVLVGTDTSVIQGQTDTIGFPSYVSSDPTPIYPAFPATMDNAETGLILTNSTRSWDLYLDYTESAGGNTITVANVAGANVITSAQTFWIISGNNFSNANVQITQNNVTINQAVNSQNTTTINCNTTFLSANDLKYGSATLKVVNGDGSNNSIAITINTASGMTYVNLTTPDTNSSNRITATADLAANDQLEISNVTGGTIADVIIYSNATFNVSSSVTGFDVRVWDTSDQNWGGVNTQTIIITTMRVTIGISPAVPSNFMVTTIK